MKLIKYIALACFSLTLPACGDFLEEYSQDSYYVSSYQDLEELLKGDCYFTLQGTNAGGYGAFLHLLGDEMEEQNSYYGNAWMSSSRRSANLRENLFGYYTWQQRIGQKPDYTGFNTENATWTETYRLINVANNIIASVADVPQRSDEEIKGATRVKGEAHFLRAAYYFWLANLYGKPYAPSTASTDQAVPLKLEEKVNDIKYQRNTNLEVYTQILADLKIAEECLSKTDAPKTKHQADIHAVHLLMSRVYLYMQDWAQAATYADKVIETASLVDLNKRQPYDGFLSLDSREVLFSMGDNHVPALFNSNYQSFRISNDLYDSYEENDLRKIQWMWKQGTFVGPTKIIPGTLHGTEDPSSLDFYYFSYTIGYSNQYAEVSDRFLFRLAEAYLNKAEAEAYQGKDSEAQAALNELRSNRYVSGSEYAVTVTGEELVKVIRDERRRELALEGHRWFDLRRYGVCEQYPESKEIVHRYTYYESSDSEVMTETHVFTLLSNDPAYTLPIPQEVLDFNTGMKNNERTWREFTVTTPID